MACEGAAVSETWSACHVAHFLNAALLLQILKPAEKKQKFMYSGTGPRPGTPPRAGAKAGAAPGAPAGTPAAAAKA